MKNYENLIIDSLLILIVEVVNLVELIFAHASQCHITYYLLSHKYLFIIVYQYLMYHMKKRLIYK